MIAAAMLGSPKILPHPPDSMLAVVDDALSFVRVGDDLEQEAAAFLVDRDVSELVDDQEPGPADLGELPVEPVLRVGAQQAHDELGGGEEPGRYALQAGLPGQRDGQVGLAGAGRAEHGHVLRVLDEVEGFQCLPPVVDGEAQGRPGRSRRASWFGGTRPA